jgi:hypothetical protein
MKETSGTLWSNDPLHEGREKIGEAPTLKSAAASPRCDGLLGHERDREQPSQPSRAILFVSTSKGSGWFLFA